MLGVGERLHYTSCAEYASSLTANYQSINFVQPTFIYVLQTIKLLVFCVSEYNILKIVSTIIIVDFLFVIFESTLRQKDCIYCGLNYLLI